MTDTTDLKKLLEQAERQMQELSGIVGHPGTNALQAAGLTESLADRFRYAHREWLTQIHAATQRVIAAEARQDKLEQENAALTAKCEALIELLYGELPGMWDKSDLIGGETDAAEIAKDRRAGFV